MELFYRGIPHESNDPVVETVDTPYQGRFLGRAYRIQHGKVAHHRNPVPMKYRGIDYNA